MSIGLEIVMTNIPLFLMAKGPIIWMSKKQFVIALSTSKVKYVAVSVAAQEAIWLRRLFADLKAHI